MVSLLDVIGVGIEVAQFSAIQKTRRELSSMQASTAEAEMRAQLIDILRNIVFEYSEDLTALESNVELHPQPTFVTATALKWQYDDIGLSPVIFSEFADKQYVQQVLKRTDSLILRSRQMLDTHQLQQAQAALDASKDLPILEKVIVATNALEELQSTEARWTEMDAKATQVKSKKTAGCVFMAMYLVFGFPLLMGLAAVSVGIAGSINETLGNIVGFMAFIVAILLGIVGFVVLLKKVTFPGSVPPEHAAMKKRREELRSKLMPVEEWNQAVARFGEHSSEEYRRTKVEKEAALHAILGQVDSFKKYLPSST